MLYDARRNVIECLYMTPDEISKATTPNALREASADQLDDLSNHATSLLLTDAGAARQIQASLQAILAEKTRRTLQREEKLLKSLQSDSRWIKWSAIITLGLTVVLAFLTAVLAFIAYHDYII